jgi:outer membrane receptor protein involved in Fe transport
MLKRILFLVAIAFAASSGISQVTTSSLSGIVTNATGEALAGASISAVHQPSGTQYATISQSSGRFSIANMRTGGPYHIEITYVGLDPQKFDDVHLKLAEDFLLNAVLLNKDNVLTDVTISATGRRNPIFNSNRTGAVTNIGRREIERLPTITRNINDLTRATPQSNGASVAGGNYRQNNFTIDGAYFNNSFGIGTNLPANGSPISLDALEEISVSISPFDIRQSGFIGSSINAITRSGTNTFSGSVYRYWRSEKQQGDKVGKVTFTRAPFEFEQWGFRVGGPIIKNKLFFFFNYETENQPRQISTRFAATSARPFGSSDDVARPTASELDAISSYLATNYDYETGAYDNYSTEILRTKYMGRLDWNISKKHRLTLRYSQVEGGEPSPISTSTSGSGFSFPSGGGRQSIQHLWFKNTNYFQGANFYSAAVEYNAQFGKFSNVLRGTYTFQDDSRESDSEVFPLVDILKDGTAFTTFGYEPFTFGNLRKVKLYSVVDNLTWVTGKHSWTVGGQFDISETINGFQRFGTSYYVFNSWDDFTNGVNPVNFAQTYSLAPGFAQAFPRFKFAQFAVYGQDQISINNKFKLTLGLRVDQPRYLDVEEVKTHPLVLPLTFAGGQQINTGELPKSTIMWSPRLGFNYDIYGDRSLQIRGGTGVFTGNVPFVWIVSQVGDAGMLQVTQGINGQANTPGPFDPDPAAYRPSTVPQAGTVIPGTLSSISPDFKFPQTWKSSIGIDKKLGWGMIFTFEAIYNRDIKTTVFTNINLSEPSPLNVAGYPDNRVIYPNSNSAKFINPLTGAGQVSPTGTQAFNVVRVTNGSKGHYGSLSARLDKQFDRGLTAGVAYTKSFANNLFDGGGDQPLSAWQSTNVVNANTPVLGYAGFVLPDRVSAYFTFKKEYFKHLATTISAFYNGSIDGRFSYVYNGDFNRDGFNGNDLIYIPKDPSEITFVDRPASSATGGVAYTAAEQSALFFKYIEQDKYLKKHKGQYAERNGAQLPWRNQVDVRLMQDLFVDIGKTRNTIQFTIDVFNFGNLLNSSWGKVKTINQTGLLVATNISSLTPGGTTRPTFQLATDRNQIITETFRDNVSIFSTYFMQFGLRYLFN